MSLTDFVRGWFEKTAVLECFLTFFDVFLVFSSAHCSVFPLFEFSLFILCTDKSDLDCPTTGYTRES